MLRVTRHRGPDDTGTFIDRNVMLGNSRLSIIDIKTGHQPIHNEDNSMWITYNGEVYNYLQLKEDLEQKGHNFYTKSDTEVILHAYEEYGEDCFNKLRGMFSLAIWNCDKNMMVLVRDRLGIKPLYYTIVDGSLIFASEIKSILQYDSLNREVDLEALHDFLTFQYVPGPRTLFKGIKKLQPGNILTYRNGKIKIKKYWDVVINPSKKMNENQCSKQLLKLLEESIKMRLMSEVPLGVFLSGGLDSSTVTAILSKSVDEPVKTFTIGFGHITDEFEYAKIVADHFSTDHHEIMVKEDFLNLLPKVVWHYDEPICDAAIIPTYIMSKFAKKYATVLLVGEGGDEAFGGYPRYWSMMSIDRYGWLIPNLAKKIITGLSSLFYENKKLYMMFPYHVRKYFKYSVAFTPLIGKNSELYTKLVALGFDDEEKGRLYVDRFNKLKFSENLVKKYFKKRLSIFKKMILFDIKVNLCDNLLMRVDKMSMANSLEARVPFLDHKLMEFANKLPVKLRMGKYIFKKSMSRILSKTIISRKKRGFPVPLHFFFKNESRDIILQILDKFHKEKYFKFNYIQSLLKNSKFRNYYQLWSLVNFYIWHKIYIDNKPKKFHFTLDNII